MKKIEHLLTKIRKWWLKPLGTFLSILAILLLGTLALLHLPGIQKQIITRITYYLHETTRYQIKCKTFRLSWFRYIELEDLTIKDPQDNPLCYIDKCQGALNLWDLFFLKPNIINSISICRGNVYIKKNDNQDLNFLTFYDKVILPFIPKVDSDLSINTIELHTVNLSYHNGKEQQTFQINDIDLLVKNFESSSGHYSGNLATFSYGQTTSLPFLLKKLTTKFSIAPHSIMLKDCHLMTENSHLQGNFTLKQTTNLPIFDNLDHIVLDAILHQTRLSSIDLSNFCDYFKGFNTLYKLDGLISLSRFGIEWKDCKCLFGRAKSSLESSGFYKQGNANISINCGKVYIDDLQMELPAAFKPLQYIDVTNTTFIGTNHKANLNTHLTTNIGTIQAALILNDLGNPKQKIGGEISLNNFFISTILPDIPIDFFSGNFWVKVTGKHLNNLDTLAKLTAIKYKDYVYKNVKASCNIVNDVVKWHLHSKDPNAKLNISGIYNMNRQKSLQTHGIIEKINLKKLGLTLTPLTLSTRFSLIIKYILSNRPEGKLRLDACKIQSLTKEVMCKEFALDSTTIQNGAKDLLILTSSLLNCKLEGKFTIKDLAKHINHLIKRLKNPITEAIIPPIFHLDYTIRCKNILPIINWFSDDFCLSSGTLLEGSCRYDTNYYFSLDLSRASITYFKNFSFDFGLQCCIDKNRLRLSNKLSSPYGNLSIACSAVLMNDKLQIDLLPSTLEHKKTIWNIQTQGASFISKSELSIGNLSITNGEASISIGGKLSESVVKDPLRCKIRNFALEYDSPAGLFKTIINSKLMAHCTKDGPLVTGQLRLDKTMIQNYVIGTFKSRVDWHLSNSTLKVMGKLQKKDEQRLTLNGCYQMGKAGDNLSCKIQCNQINVELLNPFVESVCSDIEAKLSGQFELTGSLSAPRINGQGRINQGKFKINYLNTCYQAAGDIKFQENRLYIEKLKLIDESSGQATLSGHMLIQDGLPLILSGDMNAFHLLHTNRTDNADFYGDIYATGSLNMEGAMDNLVIKMKVTTNKGRLTIVADDKDNIDNTGKLVQLIYDKKEPSKAEVINSAINLILDLTILPTVNTQVVFGANNDMSDILQGQGTGAIQLEVGTNRKPYVMGNYLFENGTYKVSVYNLIQKTFTIAHNSQVNFNGYPQEGIANIQASYRETASIKELYPESNDKRPLPVDILLSAYGILTHPNIAYQLHFPVKSMDFELNAALEECATKALLDKNYLNKQILSLLITKKIHNDKNINGPDALKNSINDWASQKIQNLLSKINNNLEIETDLGINELEAEQTNIFQKTKIKVSYLLLSERLKLSSTVGKESHFINDWEINYQISKVYNMHTKLYQQPLQSRSSHLAVFGISFAHTKKF